MAYNEPPNMSNGDWIDAAWINQYLRDNFRELWKFLAAEDLIVGASANSAKRLAKGEPRQSLVVSEAGPLAYAYPYLPFCVVRNTSTLNLPAGGETTLTWNTDAFDNLGWHSTVSDTQWIKPTLPGWYVASLFYDVPGVGGPISTSIWTARLYAPSSIVYADRQEIETPSYSRQRMTSTPPIYMNGVSDQVGWTLQHQDSSLQTLSTTSRFGLVRIG